MHIVEFGSGSGYITKKILDRLPNCKIKAVEIDSYLFAISQQVLINEDVDIIHGSILKTDLPNDEYDFAITCLVLEHLPDPIIAAREVRRVLKPGGTAVFFDNDFEINIRTCPHIPELNASRLIVEGRSV